MTTYTPAPQTHHDLMLEVIEAHHDRLSTWSVRIDLLSAEPEYDDRGYPKAPALTKDGYPAYGIARVMNHRQRAQGCGDASIEYDAEWWSQASAAERRALLDHELTHLELVYDQDGITVKRDQGGRPKLCIRKHDRQFGWFDDVAARHGKASIEHQQAQQMMDAETRATYQLELFEVASFNPGADTAGQVIDAEFTGDGGVHFKAAARQAALG